MRWWRKTLWSLVLSLIGFAALWALSDVLTPGMKNLAEIPKYIALVQKRKLDPLASSEELKKVMEDTPEGIEGLHEALKQPPTALPPQEPAVVLVNGNNFVDPSAIEKIERMNIPQSMKEEILATYRRSGILPSFQETRAPANTIPPGASQSN